MGKGIFLNIPSSGHINPSLPMMNELVARGEDIVYALTEDYRTKVEATGARFVAYPDIPELHGLNELASSGNIPRNAHNLVKIGEQLLPFVFDLMTREKPDYLIYDSLACWGLMTARKFDVPTIATFSTFAIHPRTPPPLSIPDIFKTGLQLINEIGAYWQTRQRIQQQFGIKSVGLMEAVMSKAELNLVYTSREFQPQGDRFGAEFEYVGPLVAPRIETVDFPYDFLEHDPLIYISLGTINNLNIEFFRLCIDAFKDFDGRVVMSIGHQILRDELGIIPDNFLVLPFVPQLEVLKHTHIFITHGGLNSVHESILAGVPMIVVPQQVEQAIVARQVEKFGAGLVARYNNTHDLKSNVQTILNRRGGYREATSRLSQSLQQAGGVNSAVDKLLDFVKNY